MIITALLAAFVLAGWLLRGWRVAARLVVGAALSAAGAMLAVRLGFVEGILSGVLGSSPVETLDAFAAPMAWGIGLALVAGWMVLAWGAGREAFDVTEGASGAPLRSLSATRRTHLGAALLLWLPFLALAANQWRSQQIIAVGVVGAGVMAATVGRFVLMPALFALAPRRLWPRQVDGTVDPMYPQTAAAAWLAGAVDEASRRTHRCRRRLPNEPRRRRRRSSRRRCRNTGRRRSRGRCRGRQSCEPGRHRPMRPVRRRRRARGGGPPHRGRRTATEADQATGVALDAVPGDGPTPAG